MNGALRNIGSFPGYGDFSPANRQPRVSTGLGHRRQWANQLGDTAPSQNPNPINWNDIFHSSVSLASQIVQNYSGAHSTGTQIISAGAGRIQAITQPIPATGQPIFYDAQGRALAPGQQQAGNGGIGGGIGSGIDSTINWALSNPAVLLIGGLLAVAWFSPSPRQRR